MAKQPLTLNVSYLLPAAWARLQGYAAGGRYREKIVVIESDDWGSVRVSDETAYSALEKMGYPMNRSCYSFDSMETDEDLDLLFETLSAVRDETGRPACLTANMVTANPDFEKIEKDNYQTYHFEPATVTASKSSKRQGVPRRWKKGFEAKLFVPQFHAREHVCYWNWLDALKSNDDEALKTFQLGMCGLPKIISKKKQSFFTPVYLNYNSLKKYNINMHQVISQGVDLFSDFMGYRSVSTVAPNVTWNEDTESIWNANGIRFIQGGFVQNMDTPTGTRYRPRYLGQKNRLQMIYLVRNCNFEPARTPDIKDRWMKCVKEVKRAFRLNKPAVINTHRFNYMGSIRKEIRENSLNQLRKLLTTLVRKWPDVRFISSPELGYMIENRIQKVALLDNIGTKVFPAEKKKEVD